MRSRLSPVPGPWPFQQSARAAVSSGCSSKERCGGPPTAAPSAAPPLVLRVPVCGSAISCVRVGSSSAVLGVGRDLRVFSLSSGRQLGTVSRAAGGVIGSVDVSDEAGLAVCGSRDCTLRWFDFDSFTCQRVSARRSQHTDSVSTVRFVPGTAGRRVISSGLDGRVKLWDTETGQSVQGSQDCSSDSVSAAGLLLSLDFVHPSAGSYVTGATCAGEGNVGEGRVALWDVRTRAGVVSQVTAPCGLIPSVSFCSYNSGIAAGGSDGVVRVYDMRRFTAETLHEVTMPAVPLSAFLLSSVSGSPSPSLSVDAAFGGGGLSLVAPSTSPPSPSVHGGSISSSPPSRRHIQSVCLLRWARSADGAAVDGPHYVRLVSSAATQDDNVPLRSSHTFSHAATGRTSSQQQQHQQQQRVRRSSRLAAGGHADGGGGAMYWHSAPATASFCGEPVRQQLQHSSDSTHQRCTVKPLTT